MNPDALEAWNMLPEHGRRVYPRPATKNERTGEMLSDSDKDKAMIGKELNVFKTESYHGVRVGDKVTIEFYTGTALYDVTSGKIYHVRNFDSLCVLNRKAGEDGENER